jgi:predicted metalloprotease
LGCDPQAAAPPAGDGVVPTQTAINMMGLWAQRIDTYWFQQFLSHNYTYRRPLLFQSNVPGRLAYLRNNHTIQYDPAVVSAIAGQTGTFGMVIALAHEEGHSVQNLRGSKLEGMPRELDADRLAGSYMRWAEENHLLQQCDIGAAALAIFRAGDTLPPFNPHAHGTPQQRVDALLQGYLHGPNPF